VIAIAVRPCPALNPQLSNLDPPCHPGKTCHLGNNLSPSDKYAQFVQTTYQTPGSSTILHENPVAFGCGELASAGGPRHHAVSYRVRRENEGDNVRRKPLHHAITPVPNSEPPILWRPTAVDQSATATIIPTARRYGCALLAIGSFRWVASQRTFRSRIGKPRRPVLPKIWIPQAFQPIGARSHQAIPSWSARCHADRSHSKRLPVEKVAKL
jgi:hypothetical protein